MDESALKTLLDKLEMSRSSLHGWLHFWTFLVVVGVALEVFFVVKEYAAELRDFRRGIVHPPEKPSILLFMLGLLGAGLVAIGVAGELYVDVQAGKLETEIREANELRVSLLSKEAGDAKTSAKEAEAAAKGAKVQSDKATTSASNALGLATRVRREAAGAVREIGKLKTPRHLSEEQQERIKSKIKPFPGTPFDLFVSADSESSALMHTIDTVLRSAGWIFNETGAGVTYGHKAGVVATSGISIHVPKEHKDEWGFAAIALTDALIAEGLPATAVADTTDAETGKQRDRIHVIIGSKPLD
jgi:hypothetical protein